MYLLEGMLTAELVPNCYDAKDVEVSANEKKLLDLNFIFCATWAFGSAITVKDQSDSDDQNYIKNRGFLHCQTPAHLKGSQLVFWGMWQ